MNRPTTPQHGGPWLVFQDANTGKELCAYTVRGTFPGEQAATVELLAHEHGLQPDAIRATVEYRTAST